MISDVQVHRYLMHFRTPFRIAYEEVESAEVIVSLVRDAEGCHGLGSAAPDTDVTGETVDGVYDVLCSTLTPQFFDRPLEEIGYYHDKIQEAFQGFPCAQSAAEESWLNLHCKQRGVSLGSLFGVPQGSAPIMVTIGIKDERETEQEVRERIAQGFEVIKMKIGLDLEGDLRRVRAALRSLPPHVRLTLDANQGYRHAQAQTLIEELNGVGVVLLEQPTAADDLEGLRELHRQSRIPIIADEAAVDFRDAQRILEGDFAAGVNVKLMKCGGPINLARICKLAKAHGKMAMIGCMYESNISMTTGAHLAMTLPLDFADLDSGHLDFDDDPVVGGAVVCRGRIGIGDPLRLVR